MLPTVKCVNCLENGLRYASQPVEAVRGAVSAEPGHVAQPAAGLLQGLPGEVNQAALQLCKISFSMGATIPPKSKPSPEPAASAHQESPPKEEEKKEEEEEEEPIPPPELDETGVVPPDSDEPLPMGDTNKEVGTETGGKINLYCDCRMQRQ